jgi:chromosomal replication initiation ATPase DnaA
MIVNGRNIGRPSYNRLKAVFGAVSEYYGYELDDLRGKHKTQGVAQARHLAMYLSWPYAIKSDIAAFAHRNHATVIHGIRNAEYRIGNKEIDQDELDLIRELVSRYMKKATPIRIKTIK